MAGRVRRRLPIFSAFFRTLTNAIDATTLLGLLGISWGTYTPTLTNVTNLSASVAFPASYICIGSFVIEWGQFTADAVAAAGTVTELGMSLAFASALANPEELAGVAASDAVNSAMRVSADTTNDRAQIRWLSQTTANIGASFIFGYRIIT